MYVCWTRLKEKRMIKLVHMKRKNQFILSFIMDGSLILNKIKRLNIVFTAFQFHFDIIITVLCYFLLN